MEVTKAFYSPGELAEILNLSSDTIINYIKANKLFAIKLSERTYRIPQRAAARLLGEAVPASRIRKLPRGGATAAARLRRRMSAEERASTRR